MHLFVHLSCGTRDLRCSRRYVDSLVAACGIRFPEQGLDLGPLHWERGFSAAGPPGRSQPLLLAAEVLVFWILSPKLGIEVKVYKHRLQ